VLTLPTPQPAALVEVPMIGNAAARLAPRAIGVLCLAACGDGPTPPPGPSPVASLEITPGAWAPTAVGDSVRFTVTARDATGAVRSEVSVTWTSRDPAISRSLGDGVFRAEADGTTRAIASAGAVVDSAAITVRQVIRTVTLESPDTNVWLGRTLALSAVARDARGNAVPTDFSWTVSDTGCATVTDAGLVTGTDLCAFVARAAAGGVSDTAPLRTVTAFRSVDAGTDPSAWQCALDHEGRVLCWGFQLLPFWGTYHYSPTRIQSGPFTAIGAGTYSACGLDAAGYASCWGANSTNSLGTASAGSGSATPLPVDGGHTFASLSVGPFKTCGVRPDGIGICWGHTLGGQLGRDTTGDVGLPGLVAGGHRWRTISARSTLGACGVTPTDSLFCWGDNIWGILGDTTLAQSSVPVAVRPDLAFRDAAVGTGPIACGLAVDGSVYCWGTTYTYGVPAVMPLPAAAVAISAGTHACAILTDASTYCWAGMLLGDGTADLSYVPRKVAGGHQFTVLSQGPSRACGLASDGRLYCWGNWTGDGSAEVRYAPVLVAGQP
jgi:alpha-tubulin suppressor-like RCC1 family protein